jgi:hypothetical protein
MRIKVRSHQFILQLNRSIKIQTDFYKNGQKPPSFLRVFGRSEIFCPGKYQTIYFRLQQENHNKNYNRNKMKKDIFVVMLCTHTYIKLIWLHNV